MPLHPLYAKPDELSPLLDVCYCLAEEMHAEALRQKGGDISIPYITHPIMVYKILRALGVDDPYMLAAAFLHDVIEDSPFDKQKLKAELARRLHAIQQPDAERHALLIASLCEELTNPEFMAEGKRGYQVDHAQELSPEARQVKIADQIANLIDDIIYPPDPEKRSDERSRAFNMKAREVAKACKGGNALLYKLFKVVFTDGMALIDARNPDATEEEISATSRIRKDYLEETILERAVYRAIHYREGSPREKPVRWMKRADMANAETGIVWLGMAKSGDVCCFKALVDPRLGGNSPSNSVVINCIKGLESITPHRVTRNFKVEEIGKHEIRSFDLKPPMPLAAFLAIAIKNNAIDGKFARLATTVARSADPCKIR